MRRTCHIEVVLHPFLTSSLDLFKALRSPLRPISDNPTIVPKLLDVHHIIEYFQELGAASYTKLRFEPNKDRPPNSDASRLAEDVGWVSIFMESCSATCAADTRRR